MKSEADIQTSLRKSPTGIGGLDEITGGGLPAGRPTLVSGAAGCGKSMLAMEFLINGATKFGEPGVLMTFEEQVSEVAENARSLGFDLQSLIDQELIVADYVHIEREEIEETGEYDLEGLFVRLGYAIDRIGAKRVVLDTIESLFAGLPSHAILRAELRRLFRWLRSRGMTAVITGERGEGNAITRYGLEEYVADCVIVLDHRVTDQISTRRLRVLKYRGSPHGTNEYPFVISDRGISVLPITSLRLDHPASEERVPSGIQQLDNMLGGKGFYRGSSILISGSPGTGKSSVAVQFVDAACRRGERACLFAYEESAHQILRNMRSIGIDLKPWLDQGLLQIHSSRPTLWGLEQHLLMMYETVLKFQPSVVAVDPISNLGLDKGEIDVKPTLMRLIDFLKERQITTIFTSLTRGKGTLDGEEDSQVGVSSLMDTWLLLRSTENNGERNRTLYVLKSRGMSHSNQVREFMMTGKGIDLIDVHLTTDRVLTGSARLAQVAGEAASARTRKQEHERKLRQIEGKRNAIKAQIAALQAQAEAEDAELEYAMAQQHLLLESQHETAEALAKQRGGLQSDSERS